MQYMYVDFYHLEHLETSPFDEKAFLNEMIVSKVSKQTQINHVLIYI